MRQSDRTGPRPKLAAMDRATADALDWSFDFIARTLSALVASLGFDRWVPDVIARPAWRRAMAEMRILEATARRLLLVLSGEVEFRAGKVNAGARCPAAMPGKPRKDRVRAPCFAIAERLPDGFAMIAAAMAGPDDTGRQKAPTAPPSAAAPMASAAGLARRIEALSNMLDNPMPMARRIARQRRRTGPGRRNILRLGRLPGHGRGPTECLMISTLHHAHQLAMAELNRGCPWPEIPCFAPG